MTKNKSKSWIFIVIAMLVSKMGFTQSIHFNYTDGNNASYNLEDVRKINFDLDVMNLHLRDGSVYSWNVSTIRYYQYNASSMNVQEWLNNANEWDVVVFPNPIGNTLNIRYNLTKADEIFIALYDMQGKIIAEKRSGKKYAGEHIEMIDFINLPQGTYIFRITGQQNSISKKIIKQ